MPGPSRRRSGSGTEGRPIAITPRVLRRWPLPRPEEDGDKDARGSVLVVGGAPETPGAVILAATAALRAGAGRLQLATPRSIALAVGAAVPEARVLGMPETRAGGLDRSSVEMLVESGAGARATLIGPGLVDEEATRELLAVLLPRLEATTLVLDALGLTCGEQGAGLAARVVGDVILTPHAGEMAWLLGMDKSAVEDDAADVARRAAGELGQVVALKGAETFVVAPDGAAYCNRTGNVGLAMSGSGDTLSGIIAGLAARGASPFQAAVWGVYLHGSAGDRLARRLGPLGFLARELPAEIPPLMAALDRPS